MVFVTQRLSNMGRKRRQHNRHRMESAKSSRRIYRKKKHMIWLFVGRFQETVNVLSRERLEAITKFNRGFPFSTSEFSLVGISKPFCV